MGCALGCDSSHLDEIPEEEIARIRKEQRIKVRLAIRERIMKPLQEFRFGTSESDWVSLPDDEKWRWAGAEEEWRRVHAARGADFSPSPKQNTLVNIPSVSSVSSSTGQGLTSFPTSNSFLQATDDTIVEEIHYVQPPQQTANQLRDVITSYLAGTPYESNLRPSSSWSQSRGGMGYSHNSDSPGKNELSTGAAALPSPRQGNYSPVSVDAGLSPQNQPLDTQSLSSFGTSDTGSIRSTGITKGQYFAYQTHVMEKDITKSALTLLEHRQSLAKFAGNASGPTPPQEGLGITISKRQAMSTTEYDAVEKLPESVRGVLNVANLAMLEDETEINDNASDNQGWAGQSVRSMSISISSQYRGGSAASVRGGGGGGYGRGIGGLTAHPAGSGSAHVTASAAHQQQQQPFAYQTTTEVWDEEMYENSMDPNDADLLAMMGVTIDAHFEKKAVGPGAGAGGGFPGFMAPSPVPPLAAIPSGSGSASKYSKVSQPWTVPGALDDDDVETIAA